MQSLANHPRLLKLVLVYSVQSEFHICHAKYAAMMYKIGLRERVRAQMFLRMLSQPTTDGSSI